MIKVQFFILFLLLVLLLSSFFLRSSFFMALSLIEQSLDLEEIELNLFRSKSTFTPPGSRGVFGLPPPFSPPETIPEAIPLFD